MNNKNKGQAVIELVVLIGLMTTLLFIGQKVFKTGINSIEAQQWQNKR